MTLTQLLRRFIQRHRAAYGGAALMLAAISVLTAWMPWQLGRTIDALAVRSLSRDELWHEVGWLVLAGLAIYALRVAWRLLLYSAAYRMGVELREALQARLSRQGPAFFQRHRTGSLMALATNDVDAIELAAGEAVLAGFDGALTFLVVIFAMVAAVDWRLALAALLPFPFMAFAFERISREVHDRSREALARFSDLNDQVQESFAGVRTLRALGLRSRACERFSAVAGEAAAAAAEAQRWEARYEPAIGLSLAAAGVLSLAFGGWLVWEGSLTVGRLTSFGLYLGQLIWPMFAAGWVLTLWQRGRAAWQRLGAVLDEPLSVDDGGTQSVPEAAPIRLQGVTFRYPGSATAALDGIDLRIAPGTTVGISGPTGAGKSTLLRLLLRQWNPEAGRITWGEVSLDDLSPAALRAAVAWVPQDPALFSATVAENIALGRPGASRQQVEAVAHMAAVHEDIVRLPRGYDTHVGERGVTLSGGQRQRVAIARALLADSPLLLLDDALSAVDEETRLAIAGQLRQHGTARTVVMVSHRLSALSAADHIVVLRHGRVTESGDHASLLALGLQSGWYAQQWRIQQLEDSLDAS